MHWVDSPWVRASACALLALTVCWFLFIFYALFDFEE